MEVWNASTPQREDTDGIKCSNTTLRKNSFSKSTYPTQISLALPLKAPCSPIEEAHCRVR